MSEDMIIPSGGILKSFNFVGSSCEDGVTVDFGSISGIAAAEEYFVNISTESQSPSYPPYTVTIEPDKYTITTQNFNPRAVVYIDSVHEGETNTLLKLEIRDRYKQLLKTQYLKLKCTSAESFNTTFDFSDTVLGSTRATGPKGGTIVKLKNMDIINIGSTVENSQYFEDGSEIVNIFDNNMVEILPGIINLVVDSATGFRNNILDKPITINIKTGCDSAASLIRRSSLDNYIYLDKANNWTYVYQNKMLLKFVNTTDDDSIVLRIPSQNQSLLPTDSQQTVLPSATSMYLGGRIYPKGPCGEDI